MFLTYEKCEWGKPVKSFKDKSHEHMECKIELHEKIFLTRATKA